MNFGLREVTVERPLRADNGNIITDSKGKPQMDSKLKDGEQIPLTYPGGIEAFMKRSLSFYT